MTRLPDSPIARFVLLIDIYGVDDADHRGVDGTILEPGGHPRGAAADDQHRLADAGVHGIDRDEVIALALAARIDRPDDEQLAADEAGILSRRHDRADDF